ncbi:putative metal-binding protein [Pseudomonadota bacterium]
MIVDPSVSRRKFAKEVETARAYAPFHRQGVWIMRAEYPVVFVVLVVNKPLPALPGILCGVHLDFSDYDVRPPSIQFVDPFNEKPLGFDVCWKFPKTKAIVDPADGQTFQASQALLQAFEPTKPFLCLSGVREYHESSAHSGDSWFLHRKPNMLVHLLSVLHRFGPNAVEFQTIINAKYQLSAKAIS